MKPRHHVMFIEDDEAEIATFRRLYEDDQRRGRSTC